MKNESRGQCAAFHQPGIETAELTSRGNSEEEEVSAFGARLRRPLPTGVTQPSGAERPSERQPRRLLSALQPGARACWRLLTGT